MKPTRDENILLVYFIALVVNNYANTIRTHILCLKTSLPTVNLSLGSVTSLKEMNNFTDDINMFISQEILRLYCYDSNIDRNIRGERERSPHYHKLCS